MREILFRGKTLEGVWIYGDLTHDVWGNPMIFSEGYDIEVTHPTVGEYTGLKDKEGNKIFEGDIIECETFDFITTVQYRCCAFMLNSMSLGGGLHFLSSRYYESVVIGNIHDNPEFLEDGKI